MSAAETCWYCKTQGKGIPQYETSDVFTNSYVIERCSVCNALFLSPAPTEEQFSRAYDDSYYGHGESKFLAVFETILDLLRKNRAASVARYVPEGGRVLDIGCGNGRFLKHLHDVRGCDLFGIEIPGRAAERASRIPQITLKLGELAPEDFPACFFDVVTLFHVFEHLGQPAAVLRTISSILKDGGVCVISFPNIASFQARLFKGKWLHLDPPRHLFFLEPADFVRIVSSLGFVAEKTTYFSLEQNPFGMTQSVLNCLSSKRDLLLELLKGNTDYASDVPWVVLLLHVLFLFVSFPVFVLSDILESSAQKGATVQFVLRKSPAQGN